MTQEGAKAVGDAVSVVTVVGTLAEVLPAVAALFTIIWTGLRIWETDTIQSLLGKKKENQNANGRD
jgi:FtsH-binding integral membrane protein